MKLTPNEARALNAVANSEYNDGNPPLNAVWTDYTNPFDSKRTFSGVVSSLSKKGYVLVAYDSDPPYGTLQLTRAGWDALVASGLRDTNVRGH